MPPGFRITTAAYQRLATANDLQARLLAIAEAAHADDPASLDAASSAMMMGRPP